MSQCVVMVASCLSAWLRWLWWLHVSVRGYGGFMSQCMVLVASCLSGYAGYMSQWVMVASCLSGYAGLKPDTLGLSSSAAVYRGCLWQNYIVFSFLFPVCNARYICIYIYIYIICDPMGNRNNKFILIIYIARRKMANFECREFEFGLEFGHLSFTKLDNFSEGSFELKKKALK